MTVKGIDRNEWEKMLPNYLTGAAHDTFTIDILTELLQNFDTVQDR